MALIKLTKNKFTIVDDIDFKWLNKWKWHVGSSGYAVRKVHLKKSKPYKSFNIQMHRLIANTPPNLQTDHINRNKLDNRRKNLRSLTNQQNSFNRSIKESNTSGFSGVSWDKARDKWKAYITINAKMINIGRYVDKEDAIKARREAEKSMFSFPEI